ncbi:MAG: hypothetical protein RQ751_10660, partial [Longimicrobiales bacterium]|nr:hypothetical protein [Longimicrobiales bacterium]
YAAESLIADNYGHAVVAMATYLAKHQRQITELANRMRVSVEKQLVAASPAAVGGYQLRFPLPQSLAELRRQMERVRAGVVALLARYEPARVDELRSQLETFGRRDTLARLHLRGDTPAAVALESVPSSTPAVARPRSAPGPHADPAGAGTVH